MTTDIVFEYICPVLIILWITGGLARLSGVTGSFGPVIKGLLLLLSLIVALYPIRGLSLSDYILSLNPGFSIGSIALLMIVVCLSIFDRKLLTDKDLKRFVIWNIMISLFVFIPALGFTGQDIYASGYGSSLLFAVMAMVTIFLIYIKSPLSYIFIAYIVAFNLKLLPTDNFFDYITDGILFFISLGILISCLQRTHKNYS